jgi:hypothetical protein
MNGDTLKTRIVAAITGLGLVVVGIFANRAHAIAAINDESWPASRLNALAQHLGSTSPWASQRIYPANRE